MTSSGADLPSVRLFADGVYAYAEPRSFLGDEDFRRYRTAVGGVFDRLRRAQRVHVDAIHDVIARLRQAGFHADPDPDLVERHLRTTARRWYDLQAVRDRIASVEEELFAACGRRLFPHQKPGAEWLATRYRGLLADEPGVAKTLQAIVAMPANAPAIVVAPAGVKGAWMGEIERCRPQLRPVMLQGRDSFRWAEQGEVLLTNYDILPTGRLLHDPPCDGKLPRRRCRGCGPDESVFDRRAGIMLPKKTHKEGCDGFEVEEDRRRCPGCSSWLKEARLGTVLVFDEVHLCKNPDAERTWSARAVARAVRSVSEGRVWGLSGTPMKSGPRDLWYVLDLLGLAGEAFGSWDAFEEIFGGKRVQVSRSSDVRKLEWGVPDERAAEALQKVSLRRTKEEVFPDMPEKLFQEVVVPIDRRSLAACASVAQAYGGIDALLELLEKDDLPFQEISRISAAVASAKTVYLTSAIGDHESLDRAGDGGYSDPLVVFSTHRAPVDALSRRKGWATITGDVKAGRERQAIVDAFQRGQYRGLACTSSAAGTGITLTRSHRMILVDLDWNPSDVEQVTDRIHRAGQKERCLYWVLKADHPLDRRVTEITLRKMAVIQASVGASAVEGAGGVAIEEEIRRMQEEVAGGRAVRRMPDTAEQKAALEGLLSLTFGSRRQEKLAADLAEQAMAIGLSDRQWELAARLVAEARVGSPEVRYSGVPDDREDRKESATREAPADVRTNSVDTSHGLSYEDASAGEPDRRTDEDDMVTVRGAPHLKDCARAIDAWAECTCGSVGPREDEMGEQEAGSGTTSIAQVLPPEVVEVVDRVRALTSEDRIDAIVEAVDVLEDEERGQLFAELEALYGADSDEDDEEDGDDPEEDEDDLDDGSEA